MTQTFGKWPKFLGNDLDTWKWLKNLTNCLNMSEMTYIFGKWLKYLRNG